MADVGSGAKPSWRVVAVIAAWVLPGLGHLLLGERRRAAILAVSIGLLWLFGLVIGGVTVCNHKTHTAWFAGQVMLAPTLAVDYYQQPYFQSVPKSLARANVSRQNEPSYGHMNEQGILYTALAGLLNLLAIIDVATGHPNRDAPKTAAGVAATGGAT